MQTNCLVTGAAGFIGSHLADALLARGARVTGIDNMKLGRRENLSAALKNPNFKFFEADINDLAACGKIISEQSKSAPFTAAWHLAANSDIRAGGVDPDVDLRDTFLTTYNLLKLMRAHKIPRLAFASTSAIYGDLKQKLPEDIGPLFPISNYGAMKLASEAAISAALEQHEQQFATARQAEIQVTQRAQARARNVRILLAVVFSLIALFLMGLAGYMFFHNRSLSG